jgi:hypothetical protein
VTVAATRLAMRPERMPAHFGYQYKSFSPDDAPRRSAQTKTAWVYIIRSGSLCKIGHARTLERRLAALRASGAEPIELVVAYRVWGAPRIERYLHNVCRTRWDHGEWFRLSRMDVEELMLILDGCRPQERIVG